MPKSDLNILEWNVQTGNDQAIPALTTLVKEHAPDVVALIEVGYLHDELTKFAKAHGMTLFQEALLPYRPGFGVMPEQGDTAVLVRRTVSVEAFHVAAMTEPWTGPKHGWLHAPRRYWRLRLKKGKRTWRLSADHWPTKQPKNDKARDETTARTGRWLRGLRPSVVIGDLNMPTRDLAEMFGTVVGNGPDNAIYRRCTAARVVLDNYGSDHKAVLFTLTKEK